MMGSWRLQRQPLQRRAASPVREAAVPPDASHVEGRRTSSGGLLHSR